MAGLPEIIVARPGIPEIFPPEFTLNDMIAQYGFGVVFDAKTQKPTVVAPWLVKNHSLEYYIRGGDKKDYAILPDQAEEYFRDLFSQPDEVKKRAYELFLSQIEIQNAAF
jgi:hypothetical protein